MLGTGLRKEGDLGTMPVGRAARATRERRPDGEVEEDEEEGEGSSREVRRCDGETVVDAPVGAPEIARPSGFA